jgi:hypothetical protein
MRPLTAEQEALVQAARHKAHVLYEGQRTAHRSCGICLAETFNLDTPPYQALRRGGITGRGNCGAIVAGHLVLGQLLGDPDPTAPVTAELRAAIDDYDRLWQQRLGLSPDAIICNALVGAFDDFLGAERVDFCTSLAATVAELVARVLLAHGHRFTITPIADLAPH